MIIKANSLNMPLKNQSVQAIITSPPYWGLRNYDIKNVTLVAGFIGQLGSEPDIELYIEHLLQFMKECWRVLKDNGVCFINLGDTYAGSYCGNHGKHEYLKNEVLSDGKNPNSRVSTIKNKSLCMAPERFAIGCIASGWIIRNKITWYKPNGMPSSVQDRFGSKHETIYMFTKQRKYYFDLDAVRSRIKNSSLARDRRGCNSGNKWEKGYNGKNPHNLSTPQENKNRKWDNNNDRPSAHRNYVPNAKGANPGDVWEISNQGYSGAHFATFPKKLVERMLLCSTRIGDIVLDPFGGSGTTGKVAVEYRRHPILLDLGYQELQKERVGEVRQQKLL